MVNIDSLGLGPTNVWASHADRNLLSDAIVLSRAMKVALTGVNMEEVGSTDSETFATKRCRQSAFRPSLKLPSISCTLRKISSPKFMKTIITIPTTYEFLSAYLTFLDTNVPARKSHTNIGLGPESRTFSFRLFRLRGYACCSAKSLGFGASFSNSGYDLGFTSVSSCG